MYKRIEKPKKDQSKANTNLVFQKKNHVQQGITYVDNRPEAIAQRKVLAMADTQPFQQRPLKKRGNNTDFPEKLKLGEENPFGFPLDDLRAHYKPAEHAQLQANGAPDTVIQKQAWLNEADDPDRKYPVLMTQDGVLGVLKRFGIEFDQTNENMVAALNMLVTDPKRRTYEETQDSAKQLHEDLQALARHYHGKAEERINRMDSRGTSRKNKKRIPQGRYKTPTGNVTVSGLFGQRMTQSRKEDYGGETFGSVPPYKFIQSSIPDDALPLLSDPMSTKPELTDRQRLATSLAYSLVHVSEEDRVPGTSAYFRAMNRDYIRTRGDGSHPLSSENFPARITAKEQRKLIGGQTKLTDQQKRALEFDSGESSDEDEEHFILRETKSE
ncbi:hypothetical protein [Enterobacter asburiae]|uniref:hypothetical protein n=1 Tax=Enterobacter asburiae TaxID=61645 RepID=UPI00187F9E37|nr:hypothetical protein [Enterobacter asburiae]MBE8907102.1 hypothetical protein [Enterobacter asburiae]